MGSLKNLQVTSTPIEPTPSPRISFSADFIDEKNSISISPKPQTEKTEQATGKEKSGSADFEFLSNDSISNSMMTPDELFFEGKLLPFWQMQYSEKLNKINLNTSDQLNVKAEDNIVKENKKDEPKIISWFLDDDPSPRPPTCTVLWKELWRLKNKRVVASTLSPSSSTSSSSSSGSVPDQENEEKKRTGHKEKYLKKVKKGLERNRSLSLKIRPMVNVPVCTQGKNNASLPPLFPLKKGRSIEM